jgi:hypothetical protein
MQVKDAVISYGISTKKIGELKINFVVDRDGHLC